MFPCVTSHEEERGEKRLTHQQEREDGRRVELHNEIYMYMYTISIHDGRFVYMYCTCSYTGCVGRVG